VSYCPASVSYAIESGVHSWDQKEILAIRSLWIGSLPPLPKDPSNAHADDPAAMALGKRFFFDSRFSGNLKVSCATCHRPDMSFTDDLPLAHGMGSTTRRSMPLFGVAYNTWFFWDGRKDSLWSQALGPIESNVEHGFTRTACAYTIGKYYRKEYEAIFGKMPDIKDAVASPVTENAAVLKTWALMTQAQRDAVNHVYANMGKAVEAYVRTIVPGPSRFDKYAKALIDNDDDVLSKTFTPDEAAGLRLFIGKAKCTNCHNGPLFTNGDFHNTGVPTPPKMPFDPGRADGMRKVLADEFNCLGKYSDAGSGDCAELRYMDTDTTKYSGAFKTPTLRNVAERAPYMHAGQFATLREVLEFYRRSNSHELGHNELSDSELNQLEAFLRTLNGPVLSK
ncbi:MAG TPA: cytochrome c peroxidase, partial [Dissulfurispiraceae bacterium]|nr:cytochrome c peroxidase [Dissulfurispiraceae bacterium]